jgi:hypothetical protein
MMEFLTTEHQQQRQQLPEEEELPMPSQDDEPSGYRQRSPQPFRPPPPAAQHFNGAPNLQYFGPKDYVPEVPHLVPGDFNGLEMVAASSQPRGQPRIDEDQVRGGETPLPVRSSEYLQLVPKPRYATYSIIVQLALFVLILYLAALNKGLRKNVVEIN